MPVWQTGSARSATSWRALTTVRAVAHRSRVVCELLLYLGMHPALIRYATPPRFSLRDMALGAAFTGLVFAVVALFRLVSRVI